MERPTIHKGLDGIYVDETAISHVDGDKGRLVYRDHPIESLVKKEFLEVVYLIVFGRWGEPSELQTLNSLLTENSNLSNGEISILKNISNDVHPMKVLQGMIPLLDLKPQNKTPIDGEAERGFVLAAKVAAIVAALFRLRSGKDTLPSKLGLTFHQNFLYRLRGQMPTAANVAILDTIQILQMEHGFNASTFAARVTASTLAPIECAISAAIGTLYGPLHGGADQVALEMALAISTPDKAEKFVLGALKEKQKIMGMGHRIYRVIDPRAVILKPMARDLCADTPLENLVRTLERVEEVMERELEKQGKKIKANVEFYKGAVFYALGIPPEYFTALFAMSRVFGYVAHVLESRVDNRLIRPKAFYLGRLPEVED